MPLGFGLKLGLIPTSARPTITSPPTNVVAPSISGILTEGQTLTANPGSWTGTPSGAFTYQWQRSGTNISGATASTYVPTTDDVSAGTSALTVEVTATNDIGSTTAESAGVTIRAALSITGTPPDGIVGEAYSFTPTITGGRAPRTVALTGVLLSGLSFNTSTGAITGTPSGSGTMSGLDITVTDADGLTDSLGTFDIVISVEASDADAEAIIAAASPAFSPDDQQAVIDFVVGMKLDGNWDEGCMFGVPAFGDFDWFTQRTAPRTWTADAAIRRYYRRGVRGDGASKIVLGFNPANVGASVRDQQFSRDSNGTLLRLISNIDPSTSAAMIGNLTHTLNPRSDADAVRSRCSSTSTDASIANTNSARFFFMNRTAAGSYTINMDGTRGSAISVTSQALTDAPWWLCGWNSSGSGDQFNPAEVACYGMFKGRTLQQETALHSRVETLLAALRITTPRIEVGGVTATAAEATIHTNGPGTTVLKISTSPTDFSAPVFTSSSAAQTEITSRAFSSPAQQLHEYRRKVAITGLSAYTTYYAKVSIGGVDQEGVTQFRTKRAAGVSGAWTRLLMSCASGLPIVHMPGYDTAAAIDRDEDVMYGDDGYFDDDYGGSTASARSMVEFFIGERFRHGYRLGMTRTAARVTLPDDHDYGTGTNDNHSGTTNFAQQLGYFRDAYGTAHPHYARPVAGCDYFEAENGDTLSIGLDTRAFRNTSGSMLGATQLARLQARITTAAGESWKNIEIFSPTGMPGQYGGWNTQATWISEWLSILAHIRSYPALARCIVYAGDDHTCLWDWGNMTFSGADKVGLPLIRCSGFRVGLLDLELGSGGDSGHAFAGSKNKYTSHAAGDGMKQMFMKEVTGADGEKTFTFYGATTLTDAPTVRTTFSTTDATPTLAFTTATVPDAVAGVSKNLPLALGTFMSRVGRATVNWSSTDGQSGSFQAGRNGGTHNLAITFASAGTYTVTISSPTNCALGAQTTCVVTVS